AGERVSEPAHLREICLKVSKKDLALAALERIDDPKALEQIGKEAKNKQVRAEAAKRSGSTTIAVPLTKQEMREEQRQKSRRVQLTRLVESASVSSDLDKAKADIADALAEWQLLDAEPLNDAGVKRFHAAIAKHEARLKELEQRAAADAARK